MLPSSVSWWAARTSSIGMAIDEVAACPHVGEVATGRQLDVQRTEFGGGIR